LTVRVTVGFSRTAPWSWSVGRLGGDVNVGVLFVAVYLKVYCVC